MPTPVIQIAYPHIPYDALTSSATEEDADHPHENLVTGSRSNIFKRGANGTSTDITFDLGSGNTTAAEYFIAGKASLLTTLASDIDVSLRASTDNFSVSDVLIAQDLNITESDLTGPKTEDLLNTFTLSTAYRYWRLALTSTTSVEYALSKFFFGQWFDFDDVGPIHPIETGFAETRRAFTADAGNIYSSRGGKAQMLLNMQWDISDTTYESFYETVGKFWDVHTFFLYVTDAGCEHLLGGTNLMQVRFVGPPVRRSRLRNRNVVSCQFIEELG